jgi:hypothetical protein
MKKPHKQSLCGSNDVMRESLVDVANALADERGSHVESEEA